MMAQNQNEFKSPKWLSYLYWINPDFQKQLDSQFRVQFEEKVGKKLNWNRLWLFYPPVENDTREVVLSSGEKRVYINNLVIEFNYSNTPVVLFWRSKNSNSFIHFEDEVIPDDIEFVIESIGSHWIDKLPEVDDILPDKKLEIDTYFPISIKGGSIAHDGEIHIGLENSNQLDSLIIEIENSRAEWNESPDSVFNLKMEERGLFHNIYILEDKTDCKFHFYYDYGSAHTKALEYILTRISSKVKGVISVDIINLGAH